MVAAVTCVACSPSPARLPRLVVLYAPCSVNRSFLTPYDASVSFTPHLAGFAASSLVFDHHRTESGQSGTAFASIFSGSQAPVHGVYHHPTVLSDDRVLVAESFAAAGFETHSWLEHPMASEAENYAQGIPPPNRHPGALMAPDSYLPQLLDRMVADPDLRVFVVTNFTVSHQPYTGHDLARFCAEHADLCGVAREPGFWRLRRLARRHHIRLSFDPEGAFAELGLSPQDVTRLDRIERLLYSADIAYLDRLFGELLDAIDARGLREDSLVVFTADHGEAPPRPGTAFRWTHGFQLTPDVLDVPLLIRAPGLAPRRIGYVTRSIDVAPTLRGLAGIPSPPAGDDERIYGVDLAPALRGESPPPALTAFSHTAMFDPITWSFVSKWETVRRFHPERSPQAISTALMQGDRVQKEIREADGSWGDQAFDRSTDPHEEHDVFDAHDPTQERNAERLRAYKRLLVDAYRGETGAPDAEREKRLRSLGYIE